MFCRNCGKELTGNPEICLGCGARPLAGRSFCPGCGSPTTALTEYCVSCGSRLRKEAAGGTPGTGALTTGGILSIVSGALGLLLGIWFCILSVLVPLEDTEGDFTYQATGPGWLYFMMGIGVIVTAILAIVGGAFAVKKKRFGWALTGAICAIITTLAFCGLGLVLGTLAVVLVAISKNKFNRQEQESDIVQELR